MLSRAISRNSAPSSAYLTRTVSGHRIIAVYEDKSGAYNVVALREGLGPGVIWGRGYNLAEGMWIGADYHQTLSQIQTKSRGMKQIYLDPQGFRSEFFEIPYTFQSVRSSTARRSAH